MKNRYEILETKNNTRGKAGYRFKAKDLLKDFIFEGEIKKDDEDEIETFETFVENSPYEIEKQELAKALVHANPNFLSVIEEKTPELCEIAVQSPTNAVGIKFVPKEMQTDNIIKLAVVREKENLKYVAHEKRTTEICELAVENGTRIKFVPLKSLSLEMCQKAVNNNNLDILYIPDKYLLSIFQELVSNESTEIAEEYNKYKNGNEYKDVSASAGKQWPCLTKGNFKWIFDRVTRLQNQKTVEKKIEKIKITPSESKNDEINLLAEEIILQAARLEELEKEEKELLKKLDKIRAEREAIVKNISTKKGAR